MVKKLQVSQNLTSQSKIQTHQKKKEKTKSRTRKELAWAQGGASEPWDSSSELLKNNLWIRSNIQIYNLLINVDRLLRVFQQLWSLNLRNDASDVGLEASSDSAGGDATPALEKDEREPSNKLLLTAMTSLCSEIKTIKPKLCATLDTRTLEISTTIRGEISSLNQSVQASISDIKSDVAKHDQTTLTPSPLSRPPWSVCLQS